MNTTASTAGASATLAELVMSVILCTAVDLPFLLVHVPTMAVVLVMYVFVGALVIVRMLILPLVAVLLTVLFMVLVKETSSMVAFVWITGLHLYLLMTATATTEKRGRPLLFLDSYLE